jgi:hypothetical protein
MIFLSNVFGVEATVRMLRFKIEDEYHPMLNTFFIYLNYVSHEAAHDEELLTILKKII